MEVFYYLVFGGLSLIVLGLELSKGSKDRVNTSSTFNSFKNNYLFVYSLMMAGDWLQGPYVYFLYSSYGYDKGDIGRLFIAGFGSSMFFGTIVGSLADKQGRKRACVTYCITYILSCITKHSPQYKILMLGRILGGVATSLLFSAFESWLVAEHNKRGFEPQWLSVTFSKAIFLGNGLVAIVAGLFANLLADNLGFGPVAPFDAAGCFLAIGMAVILSTWTENFGDASGSKDLLSQFKGAAVAIASDEKIALLGAIQSLFEGSMYTFVFLWTPALSPNEEDIPHGFIFATFMLSSMLGSSIASRLMARASLKVESYMQIIFLISSATLLLPVLTTYLNTSQGEKGGSMSFGGCIQLFGFCIFEACVGIFWPSIMKMRSQYIPEEARSTIMNFFRIPLNIFVCIVLYNVSAFPITVMFGMCSIFLQNHEVVDKPVVIELAVAAMEELVRMAQIGEPLWVQSGTDNSTEILNEEEYFLTFPRGIGPRPYGLKSEASRQTSVVIMNHNNLVEILMDVNQWSTVFCSIVSKAMTIEVLSTGIAGNYNGALQVMSSEVQVPSPLVPTRDSYFVRYCKQHGQGTWAVVDVSLESLQPNPVLRNRKRPSGCLIQEMPNGYSKVTWVEHVEVDDRSVNEIYKPLVNSGLAFGAKRWLATLDRQCERLASVMATNIPAGDIGVITSQEGRKSMLKLAERMVMSFCNGVSESTTHQWTTLSGSGAEDVRVMTRKSIDDPGRPPGIVLSAATSFWLPIPPARVFDFLRDENSRNEWDILSNGGVVQEMAHIANGREQGNSVSLLRVNSASSSQSNMLILQESCTDPTGSFVIYAPVDIVAMNVVLNGGDPDYVALLPSGFAVLPDGPLQNGGGAVNNGDVGGNIGSSNGGSLLTVAFQILVDSAPTAKLSLGSVATVNSLISCTVERIKGALSGGDTSR